MPVKCWECGNTFERKVDTSMLNQEIIDSIKKFDEYFTNVNETKNAPQRQYCDGCQQKISLEYDSDLKEYLRLKSKLMVNRAIRILENQNIDVYEYEEAIHTVSDYAAKNSEKFMSAHEVLTAIILIANEVETKVQFKIKNYQVDFCLPTLKIVLEIDGYMHDHSKLKDSRRDIEVRQQLGDDWEIVRIPTRYIEQKVEIIVEAIKTIKKEKQKIRLENSGEIPDWYSKKAKTKY